MGKPIKESLAEVEKSCGMIDYLTKNTSEFLKDEILHTRFTKAYTRHQPLGPTLSKDAYIY